MPLIPVPIWRGGVKMSSKSSNLLLDIMGGRHERTTRMELEFSVDGFILTYVQKYISGPLTKGDRPHGPPWIRHCRKVNAACLAIRSFRDQSSAILVMELILVIVLVSFQTHNFFYII